MITNRYAALMAPSNSSIDLIRCNLEKMCCAFLYSLLRSVAGFGEEKFLRFRGCVFHSAGNIAIPWTFEHDDQTHHKQLKRATLGILKIMIIIMTVYLCEANETPLFIR